MKILIDMGHPAHVHLFKHFISEMQSRGHKFLVTAREKEVTYALLEKYRIEFEPVGSAKNGKSGLILEWIQRDLSIYSLAKQFDPDILMGMANPCVCHAAKLLGKHSIILTDTEHAKLQNSLSIPFCDVVCTPSCYIGDFGKKHVRYDGYHELAYLHPNYFTPNPAVPRELGLAPDDTFIILRLVSWNASHDSGQHGITDKTGLVKELEQYGRVLITSEGRLPPELEEYRVSTSPEKLHDLLWYATLSIGEGATTASECAVLGTHAIYINTLEAGTINEQEQRYNLVQTCTDPESMEEDVLKKAREFLRIPHLWRMGKLKRKRLLEEKINVTAFLVGFVEGYPESYNSIQTSSRINAATHINWSGRRSRHESTSNKNK